LEGLTDRSRRLYRHANKLPTQIEMLIVRLKQDKPNWGAARQDPPASRYYIRSIRRDFESEPGSIPVGANCGVRSGMGVPAAGSLRFYFCRQIPRVILLVFVLVSAAIDDKSGFKFNWLRL